MVEVAERSSRLETLVKQGGISTPALTIDLDVLERNLQRMAAYCQEHRLGLRPHTKTHKTPKVARMKLERGACGLTVAKVGEAEVMATAADAEILVAYPIFGVEKLRRLAALAKTRTILMSLDDEATAREASRAARAQQSTLGVLVEFDVGLGRCGLDSGAASAALATQIQQMPGLKFRGLMLYRETSGAAKQNARVSLLRCPSECVMSCKRLLKRACRLRSFRAGPRPVHFSPIKFGDSRRYVPALMSTMT